MGIKHKHNRSTDIQSTNKQSGIHLCFPTKLSIWYVFYQHIKGTLKDLHKLLRDEGYRDDRKQSNFQSIAILIRQVIEYHPSEVVTLLTTGQDLCANISWVVMSLQMRSETLSYCERLMHRMIKMEFDFLQSVDSSLCVLWITDIFSPYMHEGSNKVTPIIRNLYWSPQRVSIPFLVATNLAPKTPISVVGCRFENYTTGSKLREINNPVCKQWRVRGNGFLRVPSQDIMFALILWYVAKNIFRS